MASQSCKVSNLPFCTPKNKGIVTTASALRPVIFNRLYCYDDDDSDDDEDDDDYDDDDDDGDDADADGDDDDSDDHDNRELRQQRQRRLQKGHLKSEFALPETLSRSFHLV